MIPDGFVDTGWHFGPAAVPPRRYQVFGERSSGTNFVKRLIGRNSALTPIEALGWKHAVPHMTAIPADVAVVVCVRDARSWSRSMHAKPWHTPPVMQALDYSAFIRHPWDTVADHKRYFPQVAEHGGTGQPLQHDRHPLTGAVFQNLFELRTVKLQAHLSFLNRKCTVILCRMEAVTAAPQDFLRSLHDTYGLPSAQENYRPVVKRLGSKFRASVETRPDTPRDIPAEDLDFLRQNIDLDLEAKLGYHYD
ncbi:hypothetical protein [Sagittula sp. SSi028]|uniref:hypothetical protein n=1 Tax=Sagittula sp. SSi028 TaxID=3400636 RepID=UPI003AF6BFBB